MPWKGESAPSEPRAKLSASSMFDTGRTFEVDQTGPPEDEVLDATRGDVGVEGVEPAIGRTGPRNRSSRVSTSVSVPQLRTRKAAPAMAANRCHIVPIPIGAATPPSKARRKAHRRPSPT